MVPQKEGSLSAGTDLSRRFSVLAKEVFVQRSEHGRTANVGEGVIVD